MGSPSPSGPQPVSLLTSLPQPWAPPSGLPICLGADCHTPSSSATSSVTCVHWCSLAHPARTPAFICFARVSFLSFERPVLSPDVPCSPNRGYLCQLTFLRPFPLSHETKPQSPTPVPSVTALACPGNKQVSCSPFEKEYYQEEEN